MIGRPDRLVSPGRIHDGKPPVPNDPDARNDGEAFGVGPPMGEEIEHQPDVPTWRSNVDSRHWDG